MLLFLFLPRKPLLIDRRLSRIKQGMVQRSMPTHTLMKGSRKLSVYQKAFDFILGRIQHDFQRDTVTEDPIPPAFRLAACLYCLASKDQSEMFPSLCSTPNSTGGRARELSGKAAIFVRNRLNSHVQWKSFFLESTRGD